MELTWWKRLASAAVILVGTLLAVSADRDRLKIESLGAEVGAEGQNFVLNILKDFWHSDGSNHQHVWPDMEFGWRIIVGSVIGFFGASFGSVGGVGGGGIFVPMFTLIIGFDPKSSIALSKCMIMGAAGSSVYYNFKRRHPTLDMPIIDYDLALLFQPMLLLGISIGVMFNVIFPEWLVSVLLIGLFIATSSKAFIKGVETWKKETTLKEMIAKRSCSNDAEYRPLPSGPSNSLRNEARNVEREVSILQNVYWKELCLLVFVWIAFLVLQITKKYTVTCSIWYWVLNLLQIPVSLGVSSYEAICLHKGKRTIASNGNQVTHWKIRQLITYCAYGIVAGIVGGLLGLGGGFILGPLLLEIGIPPQVSSATATFAMAFSASLSVVEYYLLHRFPVPYAIYFMIVATIAAIVGQYVVRRLIVLTGRASIIVFVLASTIFINAISLGGVGIADMIQKLGHEEYMGFGNLCNNKG